MKRLQVSLATSLSVLTAATFLLVPIFTVPAFAQGAETAVLTPVNHSVKIIRLQHILASQVVKTLKTQTGDRTAAPETTLAPAGVDYLIPRDNDASLTVCGTQEGISQMEAIVRYLDVAPRQVLVKVRLTEITLDGTTPKESVVQTPMISTTNNTEATVSLESADNAARSEATKAVVKPHINGDGSISLMSSVSHQIRSGDSTSEYAIKRTARLKPDEWKAMGNLSLSSDPAIQKAMQLETTPPLAAYPLYRVEVSASVIADDKH